MKIIYSILVQCLTIAHVYGNLWDNLWSNNRADRVVFPSQFELTLSWNPTVAGSLHPLRSVNKTNYVQGHIKIDQHTNRLKMDTKYSTLSLEPQELVSYILDFSEKLFYLKQKNSCKCFDIILKNIVGPSHSDDDGKAQKDSQPGAGFDFEVETLPNVAELFDLFPYVMYYTGQRSVDQQPMHEFKYSYPLGKAQADNDAELLMYYTEDNMDLDRIILRANSLNITDPFKLYASQPVREVTLTPQDMTFENVTCNKATPDD